MGRVMVLIVVMTVPVAVHGQERDRADDLTDEPSRRAAADGSFMALTMPARVGSTKAFAWGLGGYDSSRKGPIADSVAEARLWGPIALRVSATYSNDTDRMRPSIGARAQLLRQDRHGIDGSLSVFFKTEGFTEGEGEIETFASLGRTFDRVTVTGNLVYGQDPEGNERDGEVRLSLFHASGRFWYGLDSRARFAIGTQHGKAAAVEPTFDAMGGPAATMVVGPIALFAEVGPSAFSLASATRVGVEAFGGMGSAF